MPWWVWSAFIVFVLAMLALDLGVINRGAHVIRSKQSLLWAGFCALLAVLFSGLVYFVYEYKWWGVSSPMGGQKAATVFLTGWVIEQCLSLDNIFVIAMIFAYFGVPLKYQHRTLFWGILGALAMRLGMIVLGAALIHRFAWITYVFGALLLYTAWKMLRVGDESVHPDRNPLVRFARRLYPISSGFDQQYFFTRIAADGSSMSPAPADAAQATRVAATPLLLVLIAIESTDVIFAVDSIPAIFSITSDAFIVFTSNVFAILNLRSLFFTLSDMLDRFSRLKYSLVVILGYLGVKMIAKPIIDHIYGAEAATVDEAFFVVTLLVVGISLAAGVVASLAARPRAEPGEGGDEAESTL